MREEEEEEGGWNARTIAFVTAILLTCHHFNALYSVKPGLRFHNTHNVKSSQHLILMSSDTSAAHSPPLATSSRCYHPTASYNPTP